MWWLTAHILAFWGDRGFDEGISSNFVLVGRAPDRRRGAMNTFGAMSREPACTPAFNDSAGCCDWDTGDDRIRGQTCSDVTHGQVRIGGPVKWADWSPVRGEDEAMVGIVLAKSRGGDSFG